MEKIRTYSKPSEKRPIENVKQNIFGASKNGQTIKIVKKRTKKGIKQENSNLSSSLLDLYRLLGIRDI